MLVGPNPKFNGHSYAVSVAGMSKVQDPKTNQMRAPRVGEVNKEYANWRCSKNTITGCHGKAVTASTFVFEKTPHTCQ
jgi:hypothetical protein